MNRIKQPMKTFLEKREKHLDAVLAYFLIEIQPISTLPQSKLYDLFTPKTKYLLSHPVCQLVTELRKHFNKNNEIFINLQPNIIPEIRLLKQGIREACRGWAKTFKRQPPPIIHVYQPQASTATTSPINSILPTTTHDQEQSPAMTRGPKMVDRVQRLIGHEFVVAHPLRSQPNGPDDSAVRRRMTVQNTRSNTSNKDTIIEMNKTPSSVPERRRASNLLGKEQRFLLVVSLKSVESFNKKENVFLYLTKNLRFLFVLHRGFFCSKMHVLA